MQKITPCLWFDSQAEEAAKFYTSVFSARGGSTLGGKNSKITTIARYPKAAEEVSGKPAGSVMTVTFQLEGQDFMALNGGLEFKFTEAISLSVDCKDQEEVDYFWEKLTADGGEESVCGWLKDKFGLSWQITPKQLNELLSDPDKEKAERVMQAMLKMKKISVSDLQKAADQE